ncbi:MAG: Flp family type IVb pilin [Bacteroidota bacterium]
MRRQQQARWNKAAGGFERGCRALERMTRDQAGVTAIEYALLASLIAVVVAGSVAALGGSVLGMWTGIADAVTT